MTSQFILWSSFPKSQKLISIHVQVNSFDQANPVLRAHSCVRLSAVRLTFSQVNVSFAWGAFLFDM